jgi:hypothetical protein
MASRTRANGPIAVAHHELCIYAQDMVAEPNERPVAPRIGGLPRAMIRAVDLDDEPELRREEVDDEPPEERHLPS